MSEIKTIDIRGKQYVQVSERLRLVHDQKRAFEVIESEPYTIGDRTLWRVVVLVDEKRYKGNAEVKLNAPKNTPDGSNPFECAETSAIGRALAFAGFGSAESIASFDEVARAIIAQGNQNEPTPINQGPQAQAMAQHLAEFKQLYVGWCSKTPQWQQITLRKALGLKENEALPTEYTDDDVYRMGLYVTSQASEKQKKQQKAS